MCQEELARLVRLLLSSAPMHPAGVPNPEAELPEATQACYRRAMEQLERAGVPFLVGGAYAFARHTGIVRHTKDFDLFVTRRDFARALAALGRAGFTVGVHSPHWLGKAYCGDDYVDVIFGAGNGVARVDEQWFEHAPEGEALGMPVRLCPPEEMIWSKAFIMERERFDGADVAHLLRSGAAELDWERLLRRFDDHWRVLFTHLVLFGFIYPTERDAIPAWVMRRLVERLGAELDAPAAGDRVCRGTLLSREQYLLDLERWGYRDARLEPAGAMTGEEIELWTARIAEDGAAASQPGAAGGAEAAAAAVAPGSAAAPEPALSAGSRPGR